MSQDQPGSVHERWARLRFAVIGRLLSAPPPRGELRAEIEQLASRSWTHPTTAEPVTFGASTIERWYYAARPATDPVSALRNRVRRDRGKRPSLTEAHKRAIHAQNSGDTLSIAEVRISVDKKQLRLASAARDEPAGQLPADRRPRLSGDASSRIPRTRPVRPLPPAPHGPPGQPRGRSDHRFAHPGPRCVRALSGSPGRVGRGTTDP